MMKMLKQLCQQPSRGTRERAIRRMLADKNVSYRLQVGERRKGQPRNLILTFNDNPQHRWIFGAHYDIDAHTLQGANDNSAAVIQLVQLAADLTAAGYTGDLTICFWDLEELTGGCVSQGAFSFAKSLGMRRQGDRFAKLVLVLDVCGVGDTIGISRSLFDAEQSGRFEQLLRINDQHYQSIETPRSDNEGLLRAGLKSVLAVVLPQAEIGEKPYPKTWARLHTPQDNIAHIQSQTMQMMRRYLRSWVRTLEKLQEDQPLIQQADTTHQFSV